jgi:prolipoprotein diacylglyceryl transferase
VPFVVFADALAPGLLLAQAIGRIGNYFNQELFGTPTTLPWGLEISTSSPAFPDGLSPGTLFHPLFLYEMLWNLAGIIVILGIERLTRRRPGFAIGTYFIWYGIGRAWFESFRLDPTELEILGVKINILTAGAAAVVGACILAVYMNRRNNLSDAVKDQTLDEPSKVIQQ